MRNVTRHVILACTQSKLGRGHFAGHIYTGVIWQAWRKHMKGSVPNGWNVWALSAKHGLLQTHDWVEPYEERLKGNRIRSLATLVKSQWENRPAWCQPTEGELDTTEVVMIGGELYQLVAGLAGLPIVRRIDGKPDGIGRLRQRVDYWARCVRYAMDSAPGTSDSAWPGSDARDRAAVPDAGDNEDELVELELDLGAA